MGGVIDFDEHGLLYGPSDALGLPIHYGEAFKFDGMTCGVGMIINGGGGSKMFLVSVPKGPTSFINVVYYASQMVTLVSLDDPPLFVMLSLSLGATNMSLIVLLPLKWTWTPALPHYIFEAYSKPFRIRDHYEYV